MQIPLNEPPESNRSESVSDVVGGVRSLGQCLIEWERRRQLARAQAARAQASRSGTADLPHDGSQGATTAND